MLGGVREGWYGPHVNALQFSSALHLAQQSVTLLEL
jgi:hypothetical protein